MRYDDVTQRMVVVSVFEVLYNRPNNSAVLSNLPKYILSNLQVIIRSKANKTSFEKMVRLAVRTLKNKDYIWLYKATNDRIRLVQNKIEKFQKYAEKLKSNLTDNDEESYRPEISSIPFLPGFNDQGLATDETVDGPDLYENEESFDDEDDVALLNKLVGSESTTNMNTSSSFSTEPTNSDISMIDAIKRIFTKTNIFVVSEKHNGLKLNHNGKLCCSDLLVNQDPLTTDVELKTVFSCNSKLLVQILEQSSKYEFDSIPGIDYVSSNQVLTIRKKIYSSINSKNDIEIAIKKYINDVFAINEIYSE